MTPKMGTLVMTKGIGMSMHRSEDFAKFILASYERYKRQDWGDLCNEDKKMNDSAVKNNDDRIFARYNSHYGDIYIITEWDRSATTILFTHEY